MYQLPVLYDEGRIIIICRESNDNLESDTMMLYDVSAVLFKKNVCKFFRTYYYLPGTT